MNRETYRVEGEHIVSEEIDGETLVINYDTGTYYSFIGPSSFAWKLIGDGSPISAVIDALGNAYAAEAGAIEKSMLDFLPQLKAAGLIAPGDAVAATSSAVSAPAEKAPFAPLEFKTFTDLQDLLVLDPIHDVDQTGWPAAPAQTDVKRG
jgi:hypothetical protein